MWKRHKEQILTETGEKSAEAYGGESLINKLPASSNVTEK